MNLCCLCVRSRTPFCGKQRAGRRAPGSQEKLKRFKDEALEGDLNKRVLADEETETETATPESKV